MNVSFNKLWKLLIDKNTTRTKLRTEAKVSSNAMAKLGKNESVQLEVLVRICNHLGCTLDDIVEILPEENEDKGE
jgi:putative transcriptional regulator